MSLGIEVELITLRAQISRARKNVERMRDLAVKTVMDHTCPERHSCGQVICSLCQLAEKIKNIPLPSDEGF